MSRHKDVDWVLPEGSPSASGARIHSWESIHAAILMDIRDELKCINSTLGCRNTLAIPKLLRSINAHTKPRPRMFQGWRANLQNLLGRFNSVRGRHISRIRKSLKTTIRKLKHGLQKRTLR